MDSESPTAPAATSYPSSMALPDMLAPQERPNLVPEPNPSLPEAAVAQQPSEHASLSNAAAPDEEGPGAPTSAEQTQSTSKRAPRPSLPPQKGTTLFPLARVAKIIKELFVKNFVEEGCTNARLDKRKMVRYDDMGRSCANAAKAAQQNEYLDFLREVVPMPVPLSVAMQQRAELARSGQGHALDAEEEAPLKAAEGEEPESEAAMDESVDIPPSSGQAVDASPNVPTTRWTPSANAPAATPSSPAEEGAALATHTPTATSPPMQETGEPMDL